jgi:hypothetical protein
VRGDQAEEQGVAFGRGEILELGGIQCTSLSGEVSHLGRRDTGQELGWIAELIEPAHVPNQLVEVGERGLLRRPAFPGRFVVIRDGRERPVGAMAVYSSRSGSEQPWTPVAPLGP